jgi:hypothetical protein
MGFNSVTELEAQLEGVCDEATFVTFLSALAADREDEVAKEKAAPSSPYGPGANGWENGTIEAFLEAAAAWATDSRTESRIPPDTPNVWKRCAEIIYMGKLYE